MSSSLSRVDGFGDWRLRAATTLASPVYYAEANAPYHPAGSTIYQVTPVMIEDGKRELGFVTPSPIALCLSIAFSAARQVFYLLSQINADMVPGSEGRAIHVNQGSTSALFDAFEQFLVCVQFSYSAVECQANEFIGEKLKSSVTRVDKDGNQRQHSPEEVERFPLPDKLATILPDICGRATPKGRVWWQDFKLLEEVRHDMVHWKSKQQYPGLEEDTSSPFFRCLNMDPWFFPRLARSIISYWYEPGQQPRWLVRSVGL